MEKVYLNPDEGLQFYDDDHLLMLIKKLMWVRETLSEDSFKACVCV